MTVLSKSRWRTCWIVAGIAAVSLVLRALLAGGLGLFQDEALYWWLGQEGALNFCPHPPTTPLLVRWGEMLVGHGTLGVRAGSLTFGTVGIVLAALLGWEFYGRRAAVWAAGLFAACPLLAVTGSVATPDSAIVCVWMLFVWTTWRAAQSDHLGWWVVSGLVLALGGYTKYMMGLAVPCLALALWADTRGRRLGRRPGPWLTAAIALVLFVAVFAAWNACHGWDALRYHLAARHIWTVSSGLVGKYLGAHLAAVSPIICVAVLAAFVGLWRKWRQGGDWPSAWLLSFGLLPILVFLVPSLFTERRMLRVQWDLFGYATGIVALAGLIAGRDEEQGTRRLGLGISAVSVAALITLALFASSAWPSLSALVGARPPTLRMLGWRNLVARLRAHEASLPKPHYVLTSSFQSALCLGFERQSRDGVYTLLNKHDRQYGLTDQLIEWGADHRTALATRPGQDAIYIHEFRHPDAPRPKDYPRQVLELFDHLDPLEEVEVVIGGRTLRRFGLYRAHGVRQATPVPRNASPQSK